MSEPKSDYTLEQLKTTPLNTVKMYWRRGQLTDADWEAYLHLWQTSVFRVSQQCRCAICTADFKRIVE